MSKRNYTHIKEVLPEIQAMVAEGMTQREIAEHYGFKDKSVVKFALLRARKNGTSIPKFRGRKPAKTLQEYKYENKRLKMENELLPSDALVAGAPGNPSQPKNHIKNHEKVWDSV